jgi:prepilin-type N-terminal cleavage/methylation domain-containing protein
MKGQRGITLIEILVGMVAGALILAGAYSLWITHQREGYRLGKKIELRDRMALSSKRIQRSVTLAGLGLGGAANLAKEDAVGSDTLIIYTNGSEAKSALSADVAAGGGAYLVVDDPSVFAGAEYVAISSGTYGEIRRIASVSGSTLVLDSAFKSPYPKAVSKAFPATRERFYTDQANNQLMRESGGSTYLVGKDLTNFQVSFRNGKGESTEIAAEVRTVQFSFTGIFPAKEGALNSIVFSSTAIPRNIL